MTDPASPSLRPTLVRGEGLHVWDVEGRRYLDAISGAFCVQLGYGREDLVKEISGAASRLPFARPSVFESEESEGYARELLGAAGPPFTRVLFTSSGSEAVEAALKAALRYQRSVGNADRVGIAHLRGHFHGATLAALEVTDVLARRGPYESAFAGGLPAIEPGADLERQIGDAAALIAETIPAAGAGAIVPRPGLLAEIRRACDARDALWIADEVLTGFGRVGPLFAWRRLAERPEDARAVPDLIAFGKGAGAGYAALGGVLLSERVAARLDASQDGPFVHAQTYGAHAIACAVGRRVLAALREEKIEERVRANEPVLREALGALEAHPHVREVRGLGFLWGIALQEDRLRKVAERVEAECRDRGLLIFAGSDHLLVGPPLVSEPHHFAQIAIGIRQALDEVTRK